MNYLFRILCGITIQLLELDGYTDIILNDHLYINYYHISSDIRKNKINLNDVIDVIDDQISTPTSVFFVSNITYKLIITSKSYGVISACPNGYVSKYDYALKILENIKTILNIDLFNKKTINRFS